MDTPGSSRPTPTLATYVIPAVTLLYLAVSLRQCNILAKAFHQAVNFYPIVYALNSFEPPNLTSYVTKFLPSILGYYRRVADLLDSDEIMFFEETVEGE
ncbi:hypothetical protein DSO57_1026862 [Entomophthora muscae]|uniref:Uncharacterized protein n=1 Tax=Entomophthora muscae TaxID=34485 RepID=A0ACC2SEN1_9FUNG|nr:hypothetical protein DSO57_1026862 [Entomophthora muscae]